MLAVPGPPVMGAVGQRCGITAVTTPGTFLIALCSSLDHSLTRLRSAPVFSTASHGLEPHRPGSNSFQFLLEQVGHTVFRQVNLT